MLNFRNITSPASQVTLSRPLIDWWNCLLLFLHFHAFSAFQNYGEETELHCHHLDDDSSDDDDGSDFHDEIESSEEEAEKVKDRELEWDDSTLTFWVDY